ncbi:hypothetical protein [Spirochaeta cellobiosiphila]|uniref:hypothetical protein n=1 Tax=Spirochaeta cellobiosiphila TaxID=504483 RepID=UPI000425C455|nr:hypothetical protein [Spirochaeta cellobiosiphila]
MKELNKLIKKDLYPVLKNLGFERLTVKNSYKWDDKLIYRFQIKTVGKTFSQSTGWPSSSFYCHVEPYYSFLYDSDELDRDGRIKLPRRWPSEGGMFLSCGIDQTGERASLPNRAERKRTDIWWVEKDGSNAQQVIQDLITQVEKQVAPYLSTALEDKYKQDRDFFPPVEESILKYLIKSSKEVGIYWANKLIKFSHFLKEDKDEQEYRNLLTKLEC